MKRIIAVLIAGIMLTGCGAMFGQAQRPIIVTGPQGVVANDDSYKVVRIRNNSSAYWRFWLFSGQQITLYPGRAIFVKPVSNFWKANQAFWAYAYLEVNRDGMVKESTFAGERRVSYHLTGRKWICDTGQTIGADISLGSAPGGNRFPGPTHFNIPAPIGIAVDVR